MGDMNGDETAPRPSSLVWDCPLCPWSTGKGGMTVLVGEKTTDGITHLLGEVGEHYAHDHIGGTPPDVETMHLVRPGVSVGARPRPTGK